MHLLLHGGKGLGQRTPFHLSCESLSLGSPDHRCCSQGNIVVSFLQVGELRLGLSSSGFDFWTSLPTKQLLTGPFGGNRLVMRVFQNGSFTTSQAVFQSRVVSFCKSCERFGLFK